MKKIFVSGTWNRTKAERFSKEGILLGSLVAGKGYDLVCGPGTGMARHVIDGYRSVQNHGKVTYYLPTKANMEAVGESVEGGADEIIYTDFDYPLRNIFQIKMSDALIILTGGDGALEEAICALADYRLPVAAYRGSGTAAIALDYLQSLYPSWPELLFVSDEIEELVDFVDQKLRKG